jgi:flagellar biosynthetic protein FliO
MQKFTLRTIFFLIMLSPVAGWPADSFAKNLLQDVSSEISEKGLTVRFEFSEPVLNPGEPVFKDTSVQIDIPMASVRPAKRFFYTDDSRIPQIVASQLNAKTLRVQLVLGEKLPGVTENFQVEDQGRTLVVRLFKNEEDVLSEFLTRASAQIDYQEDQETVEYPVVSRSKPAPSKTQPSLGIKKNPLFKIAQVANKTFPSETPPASSLGINESRESDLNKPLDPVAITVRTFAMFALVLALMFLIFYVFKKYVLKNTIFGGNDKFVRVLGSGFLGPKKSIVMVEVAGEILLLGVSNDNISLLMQIQDKEKIEEIKASKKEVNAGSFWNQAKKKDGAGQEIDGKTRLEGDFKNYLKKFSGDTSEKEKSVVDVTEMIRKNLGKLKTT